MKHTSSFLAAALFLIAAIPAAFPQQPRAATPQRPTFTTDTSTTAVGTLEIESGGLLRDGRGAWPTVIKFTPDVHSGLLHRMEFSLATDLLVSTETSHGRRETMFGDQIILAARRPFWTDGAFALAVAPLMLVPLRGSAGVRFGATVIAKYARGLQAGVGNFTWTSGSDGSTGQIRNLAFDYFRTLGYQGVLSRLAFFSGAQLEDVRGLGSAFSLEQGLVYAPRPDIVLDIALQQQDIGGGGSDLQLQFGLTVNLGRPGR